MNIWYFNHYAGGPGIGKFARAYNLGQAWMRMGIETTVFVARFHHLLDSDMPLPETKTVDGLKYIGLNARPYKGNGTKRLLNMLDFCMSILKTTPEKYQLSKPDVVIVSSPHPFAVFPAFRLARRYGAKLVFEVRDIWPLSITEITGTSSFHPFVLLAGLAERFAYTRSDLVASLPGGAEPHMRKKGLARGKFIHAPNGVVANNPLEASVPESEVGQAAADKIREWRSQGRVIIIHPGAQGIPNALDRLLDACAQLNTRGLKDSYGVLLPGSGGTTAHLIAQARELDLDNIAFFSLVPKTEALWLTGQCDIGYAGARNHEALYQYGISFNKIMDFMEAGLPVVLPLAAAGDPVTASGCGIVTGSDDPVRIAAALERLIGMRADERHAMGARGRSFVRQHYDYETIAANYLEAIRNAR